MIKKKIVVFSCIVALLSGIKILKALHRFNKHHKYTSYHRPRAKSKFITKLKTSHKINNSNQEKSINETQSESTQHNQEIAVPTTADNNFLNNNIVQSEQTNPQPITPTAKPPEPKEPTSNISRWVARLGNNITQIINVMTAARQKKATIYIHKNKRLLLNNITGKFYSFGKGRLPRGQYVDGWGWDFFTPQKLKTIKEVVIPNLHFTPHDDPVLENSIIIHIRNGDIWDAKQVHRSYLQPPLAFYKAIIEHHQSINDVVIIMDQRGTPCPVVKPLINYCNQANKKVHIMPDPTLEKDYSTLVLAPKVLVLSEGTWARTIAAFNYVLTNSIQYQCQYTLEHNPRQQNQPGRRRTVFIGGSFGKQAYHFYRRGLPKHKVKHLYTMPAIAYFPKVNDKPESVVHSSKQEDNVPLESAKEGDVPSTGYDS